MVSCFGKTTKKTFGDLSQTNTLSKESATEDRNDSKKSIVSSNSEREHNFLRAAHNGNFQKVEEAVKSDMDVNSCNSNGLNALHLAAKGGHAEIVQFLIDHGANINAKTRKNNTAIHIASLAGCLKVVKILVGHDANVNEQSQNGFTPLYMAAQENHVDVVRYLLDQGADTNLSTTDNFTPLAVAIQQGHDETVTLLLERANLPTTKSSTNDLKLPPLHIATRKNDYHAVLLLLHHQDDIQNALTYASANGFTALHVAAYYGSDKVGRLLLENGAPVNCTSKNNVTPLHVAAKWNRIEMIKLFLEFEANIELITRDGIRPLHCAAREGNLEICSLLVEEKAICNAKTKNGLTPLHMVAQGNHEKLVDFFLRQKTVKINEMSMDYMTPLHIASHCNSIHVAQKLLKRGASINQRALNGFVALHIATKQNHIDFVQMLISNKCAMEIQTEMGFTALHIAAINGLTKIAKLILEADCEIDIMDQQGRTALHLAIIFDQYDIVTYLIEAKAHIDKQTNDGQTPVILAIKRENKSILRYLIDEGADLSKCDTLKLSALHWAVLTVRENILSHNKEYLEIYNDVFSACKEDDINRTTSKGITPLHLAAECGSVNMVRSLIDNGAEINVKTNIGITPLHLASKNNYSDIVQIFLECLPNDNKSTCYTNNKWTPMHFASYFGSCDSLKTLICYEKENGSVTDRLREKTENGNSCLHLAVQQIRPEIVEILLNNSADIHLKNKNGFSAINLTNIIDDKDISQLIGLEDINIDVIDKENRELMKREDVLEDENFETLLMDSFNELEFFGLTMNTVDRAEIQNTVADLLNYSTNSESIRRTDWSLRLNDSLKKYRHVTLSEHKRPDLCLPGVSVFSTLSSQMSDDGFDIEKCEHQRITDRPINSGFLVSFLVDARGGYMQAQRLPQLKIFVPPDAAPSPTRIICHLLKPDRLSTLPELNDCDGFASRILQVHSSCPRFQKPILIEVPHIASLRNGEREIVIMRKNYDSPGWKEHTTSTNKDNLKELLGEFYDSLTPENELETQRIRRIVTTDIPNYFCLISRFQRDSTFIGQEGGSIDSKVDNRIKIKFPPNALMKKIQISLEVQVVDPAVITQVLGDQHQVTVSPIITVEPKRRKFRDLIEIRMPLPKGVDKSDLSNLRILFSISEFATKWEDVTNSTELITQDDYVTHSTKISARVWLISAPGVEDVSELANKIYAQHCCTPYIGQFLAYARRHDSEECQLRLMLITDDSADKTLECQESFELIATGPEVEIISKLEYQIETAGNLVPVTKSDETIQFIVQPFLENRLTVPVRMRNHEELFSGKVAFIPDYRHKTKQVVRPITTLDILIPEVIVDMIGSLRKPTKKTRVKNATIERIKGSQAIAKTELNLQTVAEQVGGDWPHLATELGLDITDINLVLSESCTDVDKAFMTLIQWQNQCGNKATGNELNRALRTIGREDVVKSCMGDISFVEDEEEVKSAKEQLKNNINGFHDDGWDEVMKPKKEHLGYSESVNESMIAETGDDWSDRVREEDKGSETESDDKSLVGDHQNEDVEVEMVVDIKRKRVEDNVNSEEKIIAFLNIIDELDKFITEPILQKSDLDEYNDEPVNESFILHQPLRSCMPMNIEYNFEEDNEEIISPVRSATNVLSEPTTTIQDDYEDDQMVVQSVPLGANIQLTEEESSPVLTDVIPEEPIIHEDAVCPEEVDESLKEIEQQNSPRYPVLHEVFESEPKTQTEIEEEEEILPDGSILKRKIIKKQISHTITEKTTREITPEEEEQLRSKSFSEPVEVVETEQELEDGTIVKRTITTKRSTSMTTSKSMTEDDPVEDEGCSSNVFSESTEMGAAEDSSKPLPKSRSRKNRKNKSKSSKM